MGKKNLWGSGLILSSMPRGFLAMAMAAMPLAAGIAQSALAAKSSQQAPRKTAWVIEQHHHSNENYQITFTSDELKIHNKNFGYKLVSKAPQGDVILFRDDDMVMCKLSKKAYFGEQGFDQKRFKVNTNPVIAKESICGIRTVAHRGPNHDDWVAKFPGLSHDAEDIIAAIYKSQEVDGVVMKSVRSKRRRSDKTDLLSLYVDAQKRARD